MHATLTYPTLPCGRFFTKGSVRGYCFGFNGQMKDDEVYGEGNTYAFEYRIHDARIGRFLSVDPLAPDYPWNSTYAFAENRVIDGIDLEGREYNKSSTAQTAKNIGYGYTTAVDNTATIVSDYTKIPQKIQKIHQPPQATLTQGGVGGSRQYKFFEANTNNLGSFTVPGFDIARNKLLGKEVSPLDYGIEIASILPFGKALKFLKPLKYFDEAIEISAKVVKNNEGQDVIRSFVKNEDDLLRIAEDAAGGSLDKFTQIKPGWWEGTVDGVRKKIEWEPGGHLHTNEGPHVRIQTWVEGAGKNGKGKWDNGEKYFIDGHENYKKSQ